MILRTWRFREELWLWKHILHFVRVETSQSNRKKSLRRQEQKKAFWLAVFSRWSFWLAVLLREKLSSECINFQPENIRMLRNTEIDWNFILSCILLGAFDVIISLDKSVRLSRKTEASRRNFAAKYRGLKGYHIGQTNLDREKRGFEQISRGPGFWSARSYQQIHQREHAWMVHLNVPP